MATPDISPPKEASMSQWQQSTFFPSVFPPPPPSSPQSTPYRSLFNGINIFHTTQTLLPQTPSSAPTEEHFDGPRPQPNATGGHFWSARPAFMFGSGAELRFEVPPSPPASESQSPRIDRRNEGEKDVLMRGVEIVERLVDPELNLKEFHLFDQLPRDIVASVVDQCTPANGVALSLTCKTLYQLARPILLQRSSSAYALTSTHRLRPFCNPSFTNMYGEQRQPHCLTTQCPTCPTKYYNVGAVSHCTICFDCPLWTRLDGGLARIIPKNRRGKSWIRTVTGKDKRWCIHCTRFTLRTKKNKGACRHGARKKPECGIPWTFQKHRGGFGRKLWKQLYTEAGMRQFVDRQNKDRVENPHYGLRKRPQPTRKRLEHE